MNPSDPAFPAEPLYGALNDHTAITRPFHIPGLTKRELFAAMAMEGILKRHHSWDLPPEDIAKNCVIYADALIAELSK